MHFPNYTIQTQNTVIFRLIGHLQISFIKDHLKKDHHESLTSKQLEENNNTQRKN